MKGEDLLKVFERMEHYDNDVLVLDAGSIERALEMSRYAGRKFTSLPKHAQSEVIDLAVFIQM